MKMNIILGIIILLLLLIISTNFIYLTPKIDMGVNTSVSNMANKADVKQIKTLIIQLKENWDDGNGKGYGDLFAKQAQYITFLGNRLIGREQIADTHQKLFDGALKGSKMQINIRHIHFLTENSVYIITTGAVNPNPDKKVKENRKSIQTLTAIKEDGQWIFSSFQNTRIQRLSLFDALIGG